jgi:DNA-directed RNA polymerase specialized sigma24 family protein
VADHGSVSRWIHLLREGDSAGAQPLWEMYFDRIVGLARAKLLGARRATSDEEDVALSAFDSFCRGARGGRYPQLADRDNLWRLLVTITARKAARLRRDQARLKRGGGQAPLALGSDEADADEVLSQEPTPELAALAAEECGRLLGALKDKDLEKVALWKMEGYTTEEIADRLGCAPRSVERKLKLIRELWERKGAHEDADPG